MLSTHLAVALTLAASLVGCGSGAGDGTPTGPVPPAQQGGALPAALVGSWRITAATPSQQCDASGHCTGAYGGSETYQFGADGQFSYAQYLQSNLGGCQQVAFLQARGTASEASGSITLKPTTAHNRTQNTCGANTDKDLQLEPSTYAWRIAADSAGKPQLVLSSASGTTTLDRLQ